MEIKAAVLYGPGEELRVETVQLADPQPGDVLVRIVGSGVCGSDVHLLDGELSALFPRYPIVPGHEAAGIVEAVGSEVRHVKPGDHVVLGWIPGCGRCVACWNGRPGECRELAYNTLYDGTTRLSKDGQQIDHMAHVAGYAEYAVVGERTAIKIREDAPLDKVCLIGCAAATGYGAVFNHAAVATGSSALVIGCGGVGLNVIQSLDLACATTIIAVDINERKLELAVEFGATHAINGANHDPLETVRELTQGSGVDYAFEVISTAPTILQAFEATRPGGTVVVVGVPSPADATITLPATVGKTVMRGGPGGTQWANTTLLVDLYMAGKLKLDELISRQRPLHQVNEAIADLRAGEVARTVLRPTG
jgi:S-(hydroxymethyl)glutathione dehydrogenase / alcohol dehydrogenase